MDVICIYYCIGARATAALMNCSCISYAPGKQSISWSVHVHGNLCNLNMYATVYPVVTSIFIDVTNGKSVLIQVMAWCCQATSHWLSQCWPIVIDQVMTPCWLVPSHWISLDFMFYGAIQCVSVFLLVPRFVCIFFSQWVTLVEYLFHSYVWKKCQFFLLISFILPHARYLKASGSYINPLFFYYFYDR